jgi:hypothetical protein
MQLDNKIQKITEKISELETMKGQGKGGNIDPETLNFNDGLANPMKMVAPGSQIGNQLALGAMNQGIGALNTMNALNTAGMLGGQQGSGLQMAMLQGMGTPVAMGMPAGQVGFDAGGEGVGTVGPVGGGDVAAGPAVGPVAASPGIDLTA